MIIDKVTMTGADESVDPNELIEFSIKYPYVEWGILSSLNSNGLRSRFPGDEWKSRLINAVNSSGVPVNLSIHACGSWVRSILLGSNDFYKANEDLLSIAQRVQLNFHGQGHSLNPDQFCESSKEAQDKFSIDFILQRDDVNNELLDICLDNDIRAYPLFDLSHGAGVVPSEWPTPVVYEGKEIYCGYAGGLGPENLVRELERIESSVSKYNMIWIDAETKIRTDEKTFDMNKVDRFLQEAKPWIRQPISA